MLHASTFTSMVDDRLYCYFIVVSVQVRDHHKYSCLFLKINEAQFYTSKQIKSAFGHTCISPIFECAVGTLIWEYAYVDNFKAENELVAWKQSSNLSLSFVPNIYCWLGTTRCSERANRNNLMSSWVIVFVHVLCGPCAIEPMSLVNLTKVILLSFTPTATHHTGN